MHRRKRISPEEVYPNLTNTQLVLLDRLTVSNRFGCVMACQLLRKRQATIGYLPVHLCHMFGADWVDQPPFFADRPLWGRLRMPEEPASFWIFHLYTYGCDGDESLD